MNAQPHTHEARLERKKGYWSTNWDNPWVVTYGDTRVKVCNGLREPTERLVRRASKKAVARHDEGSISAGERAARMAKAQAAAAAAASEAAARWGAA